MTQKIVKTCHELKPPRKTKFQASSQEDQLRSKQNVENNVANHPMGFDFSDAEVTEKLLEFEKDYQTEASLFFVDKLKLTQELAEEYFALQKSRQEEINKFYTKKYEEPGFDPDEMYFSNAEDEVERAKITEKYLTKLKTLLGDDGFKNLKRFNKDYLKKAHEDQRYFHLIEF